MNVRKLPPAIVVGGDDNALSIARTLGERGIQVYALNGPTALVKHSRFAKWIQLPSRTGALAKAWEEYLLGRHSDALEGAVVLAASDDALELIANNRPALERKFLLDVSNPTAQLAMLDKLRTYELAEAAGVATPRFWIADSEEHVDSLADELVYPLIVKPLIGHEFRKKASGTYFVARNRAEVKLALQRTQALGVRTFLVELIPGPDDRLCSYYTYLDEDGRPLFDFTKRVIRRYPVNMGGSTLHVTADVPGIREPALRLFSAAGLKGIANVEFKLDSRDGVHKLIECNARFTAADCLLIKSGLNLPMLVYSRLTGFPYDLPTKFHSGLHLWKPLPDFVAFRELNRMGQLTFRSWVSGIYGRHTFPVFAVKDPLPAIVKGGRTISSLLRRRRKKAGSPPQLAVQRSRTPEVLSETAAHALAKGQER